MLRLFFTCCSITFSISLFAQEEHWEAYIARYEKGAGSTLVNMDMKKKAPDKTLPFLFSAGANFTDCKDGFPSSEAFAILHKLSDSIRDIVNKRVKNILAGTFTYQCQRRDYFYVTDTTGLRQEVEKLITLRFPGYTPAFNIKPDKEWEAYLAFLYPNEEIMEYIKNQKVIDQLVKAGDKLDKARQVDHWIYFKTDNDRNCFIQYANQQHYKIESKEKFDHPTHSYKLQMSRTDMVDISSISKLTLELISQAKKCNGAYDGWETQVVK